MKPLVVITTTVLLLAPGTICLLGQDLEVAKLIEQLRDVKNEKQRRQAADALAKMGTKAKKAVPELLKALKDEDFTVRDHAAEALHQIGKAAVPELIEALKDKDDVVRRRAATILGEIGPDAKAALPALYEASQSDSDQFVKIAAKDARIKVENDVPGLLKNLRDKDEDIRLDAATTLQTLGSRAKAAAPALAEALKDKSKEVRREVAKALGKIGPEAQSATRALTAALTDPDEQVRINAAEALGEIGPAAGPHAIDALARAHRKDKSEDFREAATKAAEKIQGKKQRPGGGNGGG